MSASMLPLPGSDLVLYGTIGLFNRALSSRSPRATVDDFDIVLLHE